MLRIRTLLFAIILVAFGLLGVTPPNGQKLYAKPNTASWPPPIARTSADRNHEESIATALPL
jgi:hypothetical protein